MSYPLFSANDLFTVGKSLYEISSCKDGEVNASCIATDELGELTLRKHFNAEELSSKVGKEVIMIERKGLGLYNGLPYKTYRFIRLLGMPAPKTTTPATAKVDGAWTKA